MKLDLNIWRSPDDGMFNFRVECGFGGIKHKGPDMAKVIADGCEHLQKSLITEMEQWTLAEQLKRLEKE